MRLKNEEKNFELNAGGDGKPMKLLSHKKRRGERNGEDEQTSRAEYNQCTMIRTIKID